MRYAELYAKASTSQKLIEDTLSLVDVNQMESGVTESNRNKEPIGKVQTGLARNANVQFIDDKEILKRWLAVAQTINKKINWNFDLDAIEHLQYGEYNEDQYYGWHIDQHGAPYADGRVRKCSFSVFLNDDFEGGEFDLEIGSPNQKDRLKTFHKLPVNQMLFFQSEFWHQVRPVTKGVRKSLVGWVLGPKFK